jgi:hypothetical protein
VVNVQLDVFAFVIDANKSVHSAAPESAGDPLLDEVLEGLIFAGDFDVNIQITVVHALDFDEYRQIRRFRAGRSETGHAVDHEFTS